MKLKKIKSISIFLLLSILIIILYKIEIKNKLMTSKILEEKIIPLKTVSNKTSKKVIFKNNNKILFKKEKYYSKKIPLKKTKIEEWKNKFSKSQIKRLNSLKFLNKNAAKILRKDILEYSQLPPFNHILKSISSDPINSIMKSDKGDFIYGNEFSLRFWTEYNFYRFGDKILFFLTIKRLNPNNKIITIHKRNEIINNIKFSLKYYDGNSFRELKYKLPKLKEVSSSKYQMEFIIDNDGDRKNKTGNYSINLLFPQNNNKENSIQQNISFSIAEEFGTFTENIIDYIQNGNLIISIQTNIKLAGDYTFSASLYSLSGKPLANVDKGTRLEKGNHWIRLSFYGNIFHQVQDFGPFTLEQILFKKIEKSVLLLGDYKKTNYQTNAYNENDFTNKAWALNTSE